MTAKLRDEIAMQLHASFATLRTNPDTDAFCAVGSIMNMVNVAIQNDKRLDEHRLFIDAGSRMMNQISNKVQAGIHLSNLESACLSLAIKAVDEILPRLDVTKLHLANVSLRSMRNQECLSQ